MAFRSFALCLLLLLASPAAAEDKKEEPPPATPREHKRLPVPAALPTGPRATCIQADNFMNAQYTINISVGSPKQPIRAIFDTGSYDLLVASKKCVGCTTESGSEPSQEAAPHLLFDEEKSTSFVKNGERVTASYGQGTVLSEMGYDTVNLGEMSVPKQSLLMMRVNMLKGFALAHYDAVLGVGRGPYARPEDDESALMATMNVSMVSICFGQGNDEGGRIDVGQPIPGLSYVQLPLIGKYTWGVSLTNISTVASGATSSAKSVGVCSEPPHCAVIVDSGTSLIAMPSDMIDAVLDAIGDVKEDCSNMYTLPTLRLTLGGMPIDLPPYTYIGRIKDEATEGNKYQTGPTGGPFHIHSKSGRPGNTSVPGVQLGSANSAGREICQPLFMDSNLGETSANGPLIILGIPAFRANAISFDRAKMTIGFAPIPRDSKLCTTCPGGGANDGRTGVAAALSDAGVAGERDAGATGSRANSQEMGGGKLPAQLLPQLRSGEEKIGSGKDTKKETKAAQSGQKRSSMAQQQQILGPTGAADVDRGAKAEQPPQRKKAVLVSARHLRVPSWSHVHGNAPHIVL